MPPLPEVTCFFTSVRRFKPAWVSLLWGPAGTSNLVSFLLTRAQAEICIRRAAGAEQTLPAAAEEEKRRTQVSGIRGEELHLLPLPAGEKGPNSALASSALCRCVFTAFRAAMPNSNQFQATEKSGPAHF